jgi:membrane-associated phospholipid phosphatase
MIRHFGNFGDSAVLLPASLFLAFVLATAGRRQDAVAFSVALAICLATTLIGKLAVHACSAQMSEFDLESPSGHTAFAALFYGCLALIVAAGWPRLRAMVLYAATALLVVLVGVSRVVISAHTAPDVVLGLAIGACAVLVFGTLRGKARPVVIAARTLAVAVPVGVVLVALVLIVARHWTPEPLIAAAGRRLDLWLGLCV